ncbi:MAG: AI-2E family transporter, partial [Deltaproteobacteria bacterium]|nr:AI-2E family transporter [Deltaproteobacteria bacterium]
FHAWVLSLFPSSRRRRVAEVAREIDGHISAFVRGQLTVGTILFVLYLIGLGIVGVELWFLLAVIAGFGAIIPYMGFLAGIVLSSIMALATFGDVSHLIQVWGVFFVVQFLEGTFITPKVVGDKVGLSPLVVILAIVAGGQLFGLLGVFLAVPGAAVARVLLRHLHLWLVSQ